MQATGSLSFVDRLIGAARLDSATYDEIDRNHSANAQAFLVIVLSGIAAGIGSFGGYWLLWIFIGPVAGIFGLAISAYCVHFVGTKLLATGTPVATQDGVMRTLAFASAVGILAILGLVPVFGMLIGYLLSIWSLLAAVVAIRQSFQVTTGRAIATLLVTILMMSVVAFIGLVLLAMILGSAL
jgi:Yip1 domain